MKRKINRIAQVTTALVAVVAIAMTFASSTFSDVPQNHWAYQFVERAAQKGWVTGVGDGKFDPNAPVTGAEWYTMVARTFYADQIPDKADAGKWYSDKWYGPYMQVAEEHSFNMYYDDSTDQAVSERPLTRAEMAGVVFSIVSQKRDDVYLKAYKVFAATEKIIPDLDSVDIQSNAYTAIVYSYAMGIITGVDDKGTFDGDGLMSRAQAAVVLCRMADVIESGEIPEGPEQPEQPDDTTTEEPVTTPEEPEQPTVTVEGPTEEEVYNKIIALKEQYPDGTPWGSDKVYKTPFVISTGEVRYIESYGCTAFTEMCQDVAFGDFKKTSYYDSFDDIRVGDQVRYDNEYGGHAVIVLEKRANSIIVAEGNAGNEVHWGREITREFLEANGLAIDSRYPS